MEKGITKEQHGPKGFFYFLASHVAANLLKTAVHKFWKILMRPGGKKIVFVFHNQATGFSISFPQQINRLTIVDALLNHVHAVINILVSI